MPLLIKNDPLATLAERATVARPMSGGALNAFLFNPLRGTRPTRIAYPGFVDHWSSEPVYYLDASGNYVDCATGEIWQRQPNG